MKNKPKFNTPVRTDYCANVNWPDRYAIKLAF